MELDEFESGEIGESDPQPPQREDPMAVSQVREEAYGWVQCLVAALICCILIFVFVARVISVIGSSMVPTLEQSDKVIILSSLYFEPKQGDIVVLTKTTYEDGKEPLVKRVIATENQTIDIDFSTGTVTVDGAVLDEPYIADLTHLRYDVEFPTTVPEGCVFVMGDNRNRSTDSRSSIIGMVDKRCILGKAFVTILPVGHIGPLT